MLQYLRNPLTAVWFFLTTITILSWWIGRGQGAEYQLSTLITFSVLLMAAVKAFLVIDWFMEVRHAPRWLKRSTYGWLLLLLLLLLTFYLVRF